MEKLLVAMGGFITGMAYGAWAATVDPPLSVGWILFIGAMGILLICSAWNLKPRSDGQLEK
jgi:hypothetical protein